MKFLDALAAVRKGEKIALPHWTAGVSIYLPHGALVRWNSRQGHPYILNVEEALSDEWFIVPKTNS